MGIGGLIRDWVNDRAEEWGERFGVFFGNVIGRGGKEAYDELPKDLREIIKKSVDEILDRKGSSSLREVANGQGGLGTGKAGGMNTLQDLDEFTVKAGVVVMSHLAELVGSPLGFLPILTEVGAGGLFEQYRQAGANYYRPSQLQPMDAVRAYWHSLFSDDDLKLDLGSLGFKGDYIDTLTTIYRPLLDEDTARQLILRQSEKAAMAKEDLAKAGWTKERIAALEELYQVIPGVQDLIRMAVREAFSPDIAEEFGQYEDKPSDVYQWAAKQGLSDEWVDRYWAAHWDLPSSNQAFEMYHRTTFQPTPFSGEPIGESNGRRYYRVIDEQHLSMLLRALDVMPAWRDKLRMIAFSPYTRVDVRRMFNLGIIGRDEVKRTYTDLGYDNEHAENLTEFTVQDAVESSRSVTESKILKAFRQGDIDRNTALELLQEIGYTEEDADFVLATEEDNVQESKRDLTVSNIKSLYLVGINDKTETTQRMADLGYPAESIADLYELWDLEMTASVRVPTRSELTHFLSIGIIDETEFRNRMAADGYQEEHVGWYLQELAADEVAAAEAAEEKARTAQEKVEAAKVKSEYEEAKARLDVEIAVRRTYIADQQLAALQTDDDELKDVIKENIAAARLEIADLQEQKARLKL